MADNGVSDHSSPVVEGNVVHVGGETHVLNYDTNILSLDNMINDSAVIDREEITDELDDADDEVDEEDVELSPGGILDEETIGRGLSNLGRSADGAMQVYLHVTVPGFSLKDIEMIEMFVHLQKVELPYNEITDLSPLSHLKYMLILDVSHNKINRLLDFEPPKNLKEVDLSYNEITEMSDLSQHHYLMKLNLNHNHISEIHGLQNCQRLNTLQLAHNKISKIQGLDCLPIQHLDLCHNQIKRIENLETLKKLLRVNFAGNNIRSLKGLQEHDLLESIDLEDNEVIDISEVKYIQDLEMLRVLNLLRNPIQELPDYRLSILYRMQRLNELDRHRVEAEEKVASVNMFNPPLEVIAARDHIMHVVYSFLQLSRVLDSTLPSIETPYPMLVLVGPQGSGKKNLAMKLVDEFSDYFGYAVSHTTRKKQPDETDGVDYHFVTLEKFEMDIKMGQFLQTYQYHGDWYGLQMESIESVAREGLACVVHMELEGVLTIKNTYFEPRYVLIMPLGRDCHEKRLREKAAYTESQIEYTLSRGDLYAGYNQEHPGFFDMMIDSDDIQVAYKRLRRLVMDYLGISLNRSPAGSIDGDAETHIETDVHGTTQIGTRTWSKPSIADSAGMSQAYTRTKATQSPVQSGRGMLEEASWRRRHSAARDAVSGYIPPLFEQIVTQYPKTAPQTVEGQMGLGDGEVSRSYSAPVQKPPHAESDEDSSSDERSDSMLSVASAGDMGGGSPEGSVHGGGKGPQLPTETMNPLEFMEEEKGGKSQTSQPAEIHEARPPSAPRPGSRSRPGSDRHKVLPPISPIPKVNYIPEY
ncbi:leucine-rich repeat and guanylate kinase domain-containing protein-like [Pecten maximus]|uniref:leucine-rich repeat and guanylate kinase domain-containing protein-like n=1 Tax=Pecten maximus TaxID=6579 RepID=UPI001458EFC7|nr:leucine-rich repeat and guanylate kinase domain-containing protein-like [Pecten maximus]